MGTQDGRIFGKSPSTGEELNAAAVAASGAVSMTTGSPDRANILSGSNSLANSITEAPFLLIPAGRTWYGEISAYLHNIGPVDSIFSQAAIFVRGAGAVPASGTMILRLSSNGKGAAGNGIERRASGVYVSAPPGNSVDLTMGMDMAASTLRLDANANGVLL